MNCNHWSISVYFIIASYVHCLCKSQYYVHSFTIISSPVLSSSIRKTHIPSSRRYQFNRFRSGTVEDVTTDTSPSTSMTESSPDDGYTNTDDDTKDSKSATLTFKGNCSYMSKPLPIPSHHHNPSSLIDFFSDESHQNILLSGANKKESTNTEINNDSQKEATDESFVEYIRDREMYNSFIDTWMRQSHHMHGKTYRPNYEEDSIAIVQPDGIPMAGITVSLICYAKNLN